jgi:hypothetical protein
VAIAYAFCSPVALQLVKAVGHQRVMVINQADLWTQPDMVLFR